MNDDFERDVRRFTPLAGLRTKSADRHSRAPGLVYGTTASTRDPARFSFAHGGKDGHPFPVDRETYDRTIGVLASAVTRARGARVDDSEKVAALKRLSAFGGPVPPENRESPDPPESRTLLWPGRRPGTPPAVSGRE